MTRRLKPVAYYQAEIDRQRQQGSELYERIQTLRQLIEKAEKGSVSIDPAKLRDQLQKAVEQMQRRTIKIEELRKKVKAE